MPSKNLEKALLDSLDSMWEHGRTNEDDSRTTLWSGDHRGLPVAKNQVHSPAFITVPRVTARFLDVIFDGFLRPEKVRLHWLQVASRRNHS